MKIDFICESPTRIHFGRQALEDLKEELANYGKTVMLVYGKGAIKKMGLYDRLISICRECGKKVVELPGVMSNPTYRKMMEGCELARANDVDLILAVGGGSVIDCAKAISVSAHCKGDAWTRYWKQWEEVDNPIIPVASILTMAGTGSEINFASVITNENEKLKIGREFSPAVCPRFAILNPEYTYSVPKYQMVSGIFDMMSHLMESYFAGDDNSTSNYIIEALLRSIIDNTRVALQDPLDYEARANLMWCATMALNPVVYVGKEHDWYVHFIEHQLGAYTDCTHGMGLAAISLPYYRYVCQYAPDKFVRFAKEVWRIDDAGKNKMQLAMEGIDALEQFTKEYGIITRLRELDATEEMLPLIAKSTIPGGGYKKLTTDEVLDILKAAY